MYLLNNNIFHKDEKIFNMSLDSMLVLFIALYLAS